MQFVHDPQYVKIAETYWLFAAQVTDSVKGEALKLLQT